MSSFNNERNNNGNEQNERNEQNEQNEQNEIVTAMEIDESHVNADFNQLKWDPFPSRQTGNLDANFSMDSGIKGVSNSITRGNSFPLTNGRLDTKTAVRQTAPKVQKEETGVPKQSTQEKINKRVYKILGTIHTRCSQLSIQMTENEYLKMMNTLQSIGVEENGGDEDDEIEVVSTSINRVLPTSAVTKHLKFFKYDPFIIRRILVNALNMSDWTPEKIKKYNELAAKAGGREMPPMTRPLGQKGREIYCSNFITDSLVSAISPLNGLWMRITKVVTRGGWKVTNEAASQDNLFLKNKIGWCYNNTEIKKKPVVFSHGFYVQLFDDKNSEYPLDMGMTNSANVPRSEAYWTKRGGSKNPTFYCDKSYSKCADAALITLSRTKDGKWQSTPNNTAYPVLMEDLPTSDSNHQVSGDIYCSMGRIKPQSEKPISQTLMYNTKLRIGQMCSWWTSNPAPMPRNRSNISNVFALIDCEGEEDR